MWTLRLVIFSLLTLGCRFGPSDKKDFSFLIEPKRIPDVRRFENKLGSREIFVQTQIYSSDTKPSEFDKKTQPLIFMRTKDLKMPVYVYYFFSQTDSSIYEVDYNWLNLNTEIEKDSSPIDLRTLPTLEDYRNEFNRMTEILNKHFGQYNSRTNYGEIRTWAANGILMDLYLKDGQREERLLRLTTKFK